MSIIIRGQRLSRTRRRAPWRRWRSWRRKLPSTTEKKAFKKSSSSQVKKLMMQRDVVTVELKSAKERNANLEQQLSEQISRIERLLSIQNSEPPHFICPISQEVMNDPHFAADGHTYIPGQMGRAKPGRPKHDRTVEGPGPAQHAGLWAVPARPVYPCRVWADAIARGPAWHDTFTVEGWHGTARAASTARHGSGLG
uniref:U-box domain-containing protein n=1 Tax=Oryza sativa subsp. indica TaxID=39946 RepID=A0A1V1H333_ORYSI|nr:hypothetical protein [Oryza sativa Indica Group]